MGSQAETRANSRDHDGGPSGKAIVVKRFSDCEGGFATPDDDDAMAWSLAIDLLGIEGRRWGGRGMSPLPSIFDMARQYQTVSDAWNRIDEARTAGDVDATVIANTAEDLWLERHASIVDMVLTIPA